MSPSASPIIRTDAGPIAILTLNRPDKLNAINTAMLDALDAHLDTIEKDDSLGFVIAASGRAFCVGSDLKEDGGDARARIRRMHRLMLRMRAFSKISVAAVHGHALGGGVEIALGCTFRVVDPGARFGLPEIKLSVIPCYGATQLLPRLIGESRSLDMMLSGESIDAVKSHHWGLADEIATPGQLIPTAIEFVEKRASFGKLAQLSIREAVYAGSDLPIEAGLAKEFDLAIIVADSDEAAAGIEAFRARSAA